MAEDDPTLSNVFREAGSRNEGFFEEDSDDEGGGPAEVLAAENVPAHLVCPLAKQLFRDPVTVAVPMLQINRAGTTYERAALKSFWAQHGSFADPLTKEALGSDEVDSNLAIRYQVSQFLEAHPRYTPEGWPDRSLPGVHRLLWLQVRAGWRWPPPLWHMALSIAITAALMWYLWPLCMRLMDDMVMYVSHPTLIVDLFRKGTGESEVLQFVQLLAANETGDRVWAASKLANLCKSSDEHRLAAAKAGAIRALESLLRAADVSERARGLQALRYITHNISKHKMIVANLQGMAATLLEFVKSGGDAEREQAAGLVLSLTVGPRNQEMFAGALEHLTASLASDGAQEREFAAGAIWNLVAKHSENQATARRFGGFVALVPLLQANNSVERKHAAGALQVIDVEDSKLEVARAGAVPPLISMLNASAPEERRQAASTIRRLATNASEIQLEMIQAGILEHLVPLLDDSIYDSVGERVEVLRTLGVLTLHAEGQRAFEGGYGVSLILKYLKSTRESERHEVVSIVRHLASKSRANRELLVDAGGAELLVNLLNGESSKERRLAAGALRSLAVGQEMQLEVSEAGAVFPLLSMLSAEAPAEREQAAATLRTLVLNNPMAAHYLAQAGAIEPLLALLAKGPAAAKQTAAGTLREISLVAGAEVLNLAKEAGLSADDLAKIGLVTDDFEDISRTDL